MFLVLGVSVTPRRFATVSTVYLAVSLVGSLARFGVYDAVLGSRLSPAVAASFTQQLFAVALAGAVLGGFLARVEPVTAFGVVGSFTGLAADGVRQYLLTQKRDSAAFTVDGVWVVGSVAGGLVGWAVGSVAVGVTLGWAVGALVAVLFVPSATWGLPSVRSALSVETLTLAFSGNGAFFGSILGLVVLERLGLPEAATVALVARMVGIPSLVVYSALRIGNVAASSAGRPVGLFIRSGLLAGVVVFPVVGVFWVLSFVVDGDSAIAVFRPFVLVGATWAAQTARILAASFSDAGRLATGNAGNLVLSGIGFMVAFVALPVLATVAGPVGAVLAELVLAVVVAGVSWRLVAVGTSEGLGPGNATGEILQRSR